MKIFCSLFKMLGYLFRWIGFVFSQRPEDRKLRSLPAFGGAGGDQGSESLFFSHILTSIPPTFSRAALAPDFRLLTTDF